MNRHDDPRGPYEVGRGKPPRHTRFKPGQSGNPGGRRRGSDNLKTVLERVLASEIETTEKGRRRTVAVLEALILSQVQLGLRGNTRAIDSVLDRLARYETNAPAPAGDVVAEDEGILTRFLTHQARASGPAADGPVAKDASDGEREGDV